MVGKVTGILLGVILLSSILGSVNVSAFADSDDDQHEGKVNKKNRVWTGDGPPLPKLGKINDLYIDNASTDLTLYEKKAKGKWDVIGTFQGPQGDVGPQGSPGVSPTVTTELPGANCSEGGLRIVDSFFDVFYVCNGIPGLQGDKGDKGESGQNGVDGQDGFSCWDLNENNSADFPNEDVNVDSAINVLDCKGQKGDQGPPGTILPQTCPSDNYVSGINTDGTLICTILPSNSNAICGDNIITSPEQCDDGGMTASCDSDCTASSCGDGLTNLFAGEQCDDGNTTEGDGCTNLCQSENMVTFSGLARNSAGTTLIPSVWAFQGQIGVAAGNNMCRAIGADHVCSYDEIVLAKSKGELDNLYNELPLNNKSLWIHRLTPVTVGSETYAPGAGARCNDWTFPGNHIADGEYATVSPDGTITYRFDSNSCYTGNAADGCAVPADDLLCGDVSESELTRRNIACCFP